MDRSGIRRLGVFGGTFDPIHVGHLKAAEEASDAFDLERVVFMPAGRPWMKSDFSDPEDRFLMTELATLDDHRFAVSRMELDRRGPTYTVDTLQQLHDFYDDCAFFFIAGADAVAKIGSWNELERLAELTEIVCVSRPGDEIPAPEPGWPVLRPLEITPVDVSSTEIRDRVRSGRSIEGLVPEAVAAYISDRGLYRERDTQ